jgi:glycosyltransferase involved in cell wall biosynthesis
MNIGIDASNIRKGGGLTHLKEILKYSNPSKQGFTKIHVWSNTETLQALQDLPWLVKQTHPWLNKGVLLSFLYQWLKLASAMQAEKVSIAFVPGGVFFSRFKPFVTMSQNMLPFELTEAFRFKNPKTRARFLLLRFFQSYTFKKAKSVIFLTKYAKNYITSRFEISKKNTIIPHGINLEWSQIPKIQIDTFSEKRPLQLLYVSIITAYKHQWNVAEAICKLYQKGLHIQLELIGPPDPEGIEKLNLVEKKYPVFKQCIFYKGEIPHSDLFTYYKKNDAFVFASTCENLPIIMLEAMAAGLPIISSNFGPMPEVLGTNEGCYFNPEKVHEIENQIEKIYYNSNLRSVIAQESYAKAIQYKWENTADTTFKYLSSLV